MNTWIKVGRVIFGIPMLVFGVNHFLMMENMQRIVPGWLPFSAFWVAVTGILLIAAGICIIGGLKGAFSLSVGLAVFLCLVILTVHLPGVLDEATRQTSMINLLKDFALLGASLSYAGLFQNMLL